MSFGFAEGSSLSLDLDSGTACEVAIAAKALPLANAATITRPRDVCFPEIRDFVDDLDISWANRSFVEIIRRPECWTTSLQQLDPPSLDSWNKSRRGAAILKILVVATREAARLMWKLWGRKRQLHRDISVWM